MSATTHEKSARDDSGNQPVRVPFPNALRNDGLADTYVGTGGNLWLVPNRAHDFGFTARLYAEGLSAGQVTDLYGKRAIRYAEDCDLITLPSLMNVATNAPDGMPDVIHVLQQLGEAAQTWHRRFHVLPQLQTIEGIAVDRTRGRIELVAPYQMDDALAPVDVFYALEDSAFAQARTINEMAIVRTCFNAAYPSFAGEADETRA